MIFSLFIQCPQLNCVHSSMPKLADKVIQLVEGGGSTRAVMGSSGANELIKRTYCKIKKYALVTSTT